MVYHTCKSTVLEGRAYRSHCRMLIYAQIWKTFLFLCYKKFPTRKPENLNTTFLAFVSGNFCRIQETLYRTASSFKLVHKRSIGSRTHRLHIYSIHKLDYCNSLYMHCHGRLSLAERSAMTNWCRAAASHQSNTLVLFNRPARDNCSTTNGDVTAAIRRVFVVSVSVGAHAAPDVDYSREADWLAGASWIRTR